MGYKWLPVTEDFDKSLVIKRWRFDVNIPISGNYDGALSELPNIDIKTCWNNPQPENGYAFSNRFNLGTKYFSSRYYGWTDKYWTATTEAHTTLVSGTTYEFECPVDLYWAGVRESTFNSNIPNYMWFYVQSTTFEIRPEEESVLYTSGTTTITLSADEGLTWTASTTDNWLTLSTLTGTGNANITLSYRENKAPQPREGRVTFTSSEGDVLTYTITQDKRPILVYNRPIYRSGSIVKKMYRSGELIYQRLNPPEPEPIYSAIPLTMEFNSAGTIIWQKQGNPSSGDVLEYRINQSENWTSITAMAGTSSTIQVQTGDRVEFRGITTGYGTNSSNFHTLKTSASHKLYGNIMSLIYGVNFVGQTLLNSKYAFYGFFANNTGIQTARNLYMPTISIPDFGYNRMFIGCTNMVEAPELPVITFNTSSSSEGLNLERMFYNCAKLKYIKCLCENPAASRNGVKDWTYGVSATGTFVKNSVATSWESGVSGIPTGWVVRDA